MSNNAVLMSGMAGTGMNPRSIPGFGQMTGSMMQGIGSGMSSMGMGMGGMPNMMGSPGYGSMPYGSSTYPASGARGYGSSTYPGRY